MSERLLPGTLLFRRLLGDPRLTEGRSWLLLHADQYGNDQDRRNEKQDNPPVVRKEVKQGIEPVLSRIFLSRVQALLVIRQVIGCIGLILTQAVKTDRYRGRFRTVEMGPSRHSHIRDVPLTDENIRGVEDIIPVIGPHME